MHLKVRYHAPMFMTMIRTFLMLCLLSVLGIPGARADSVPLESPTCNISLAQWESPDRSRTLLAEPALRRLLQTFHDQPKSRLRIEYPGGEQGVIWGNRMMDWLVAFGIPRQAMILFPGGSDMSTLALSLQSSQGGS